MIKGILFDMDGVLFDTERPAAQAEHEAAEAMGLVLPDALTRQFIGVSADAVRAVMLGHFGPGFDYDTFISLMRDAYARILADEGGPLLMPGAADTIRRLHAQGYRLCVASSSPAAVIRQNLAHGGLAGYFERVVGGDEVARSKPAPDIFLAAAAALGLAPAACLAVEDSHNGVRSAAAAGCTVVMVPDRLPPTGEMRRLAAAVLDRLDGLPAFLARREATP